MNVFWVLMGVPRKISTDGPVLWSRTKPLLTDNDVNHRQPSIGRMALWEDVAELFRVRVGGPSAVLHPVLYKCLEPDGGEPKPSTPVTRSVSGFSARRWNP